MSERITFLKRNLTQNSFGEIIENYTEIGKGWAAIKFKSVGGDGGDKPSGIIYQATLQKPIPKFDRIIWRKQQYTVKSKMLIESDYHTVTALIQAISDDR